METPKTAKPKRRGLPVWTLLVAMSIGAVVLIGLLVVLLMTTRSQNKELRQAQHQAQLEKATADKLQAQNERELTEKQIEIQKLKATESRALAAQQRQLLLTHTAAATNALGQLLAYLRQTDELADSLKTGEAGRRAAQHADLLPQARRIFDVTLPGLTRVSEVVTKLEGVRRIQLGLLEAAESEFTPRDETTVEVQNSTIWAQNELRRVSDAQTLLRSLIQESKVRISDVPLTADSPTLEQAVATLNEAEAIQRQRALLDQTDKAKAETQEKIDKAEVTAITTKGDVAAEGLLAVARAEAKKILEEARIVAARVEREAVDARRTDQITGMREEAAGQAKEIKAQVETSQILREADKVRLRAKASSAEVQSALSPFITPGLWKIGGGVTNEKRPHSFNALKNSGALDPSVSGLQKLATIARGPVDKIRPRWKMGPTFYNNPVQAEKVREAQQLLIELGEVLVEMGLLDE
jgi:hypothetical protein